MRIIIIISAIIPSLLPLLPILIFKYNLPTYSSTIEAAGLAVAAAFGFMPGLMIKEGIVA